MIESSATAGSTGSPVLADESAPALEFDQARYDTELGNDLDMTPEQRLQLLQSLWEILQYMVELGYSVADTDICGSIFGPFSEAAKSFPNLVESSPETSGVSTKDGEVASDDKR